MNRGITICLFLAMVFAFPSCNGASNIAVDRLGQDGNKGFMVKTLQRGFWTRKYGLFVPLSYHPGTSQKYPVIIFLHGIGEGDGLGEGDLKNMTVGIGPAIARKADKFEFIVIFPQSDGGWGPGSDYTQDMFTALANTCREYPVDSDRVALTGLSTGGAGTWAIGAKYSDQFSALVPMGSNGSNQEDASRLTHVAVRAYCSMFGDIFAGWNDQGMVNRIKELNPSANAQFISTPTIGHDCWENVYGGDEIYQWLLRQRRSGSTAAATEPVSTPVIQASIISPPPEAPVVRGVPSRMSSASSRVMVSDKGARNARPVLVPETAPRSPAPPTPTYLPQPFIAPPEAQRALPPAAPSRTPPASINTPW